MNDIDREALADTTPAIDCPPDASIHELKLVARLSRLERVRQNKNEEFRSSPEGLMETIRTMPDGLVRVEWVHDYPKTEWDDEIRGLERDIRSMRIARLKQ